MGTLTLSHLSAGYPDREVLREVSLDVKAGELMALVGPNGAGKSTLIRVVSGVIPAKQGQVRFGAADLLRMRPMERARRVAVVPQHHQLPGAFIVAEVVLMGRTPYLSLWANESQQDYEIAWQAMRSTAVDHLADRRMGELSGGEQQRIVIARALAQEPEVLLLDEPTAHLDLKHQAAVLDLIQGLARAQKLAVLLTMHDLNQATSCADRMALLVEGTISATGTPDQVITAAALSAAYDMPIEVIAHPYHGTPLVIPDGGRSAKRQRKA